MMDDRPFGIAHGFAIDRDQVDAALASEVDIAVPKGDVPIGGQAALPQAVITFTAGLDPGVAERCRASGLLILRNERQSSANRIDIGEELNARKGELRHGRFKSYVASLGLGMRYAEHCMRIAEVFGTHRDTAAMLSFNLLKELSVKDVSADVRATVIAQLAAGAELTPQAIRKLIKNARGEGLEPVPPQDPAPDRVQPVPERVQPSSDMSAAPVTSLRAIATRAQPDEAVVRFGTESAEFERDAPDNLPAASTPEERAVALIVAKMSILERLELGRCLQGVNADAFITHLRQRCGHGQPSEGLFGDWSSDADDMS